MSLTIDEAIQEFGNSLRYAVNSIPTKIAKQTAMTAACYFINYISLPLGTFIGIMSGVFVVGLIIGGIVSCILRCCRCCFQCCGCCEERVELVESTSSLSTSLISMN